jgi:hypothetical protein
MKNRFKSATVQTVGKQQSACVHDSVNQMSVALFSLLNAVQNFIKSGRGRQSGHTGRRGSERRCSDRRNRNCGRA